jgi:2-desacetyl-2-hydroxyethyl bacteriochlorophyllide A dehydrogenase
MKKANELWFTSPCKIEVKEVDLLPPKEGQLLVRSVYSMVSAGTERLVSSGQLSPQNYNEMKVPYMQGDFTFPFTYGYSLVGEVMAGDDELKGKFVHLLHPHKEAIIVKSKDVFVLPNNTDLKNAVLASNLETAVNAVWDSKVSIGDKALVVGFGLIGALLAGVLKLNSLVQVFVVENNPKRAALAKKLGFEVLEKVPNNYFDVAFHSSANEVGLQQCIDAVAYEGTVVELSWYGDKAVTLNLGGDFHSKRKKIIASQVSHIPSDKMNRWDYLRRKNLVFDILQHDYFAQLPMIEIALEDCDVLYAHQIPLNYYLGVRIKY